MLRQGEPCVFSLKGHCVILMLGIFKVNLKKEGSVMIF